jgi:hypothetical protein
MTKTAVEKSHEARLRDWNKILGLWRACGKDACRRAGCCRGNPRACAPKTFAAAPEGVQAWFAILVDCKQQGLPFDAMMAQLKDTPAEEAFQLWHAGDEAEARNVKPG